MKVFGITDRGIVRSENQDRFQYKLVEEKELAILVLCDGKVNGILDGHTATKEEVGLLMTHMKKTEEGDAK